jgi:hypothetical protein
VDRPAPKRSARHFELLPNGVGCGMLRRPVDQDSTQYEATLDCCITSQLTCVVENKYTTTEIGLSKGHGMAFVRRKGNSYFLVHNVRRSGKVKQLHLARLGSRPRITDEVVRQVSRAYPFVAVNWAALREHVNNRVELFDSKSAYLRKLVASLRTLNLDLADLFPPVLDVSEQAVTGHDLVTQLRLLHSTVHVKLDQFERVPQKGALLQRNIR